MRPSLDEPLVIHQFGMAVVRQMGSLLTAMYLHKVVETGATESLFGRPAYPTRKP